MPTLWRARCQQHGRAVVVVVVVVVIVVVTYGEWRWRAEGFRRGDDGDAETAGGDLEAGSAARSRRGGERDPASFSSAARLGCPPGILDAINTLEVTSCVLEMRTFTEEVACAGTRVRAVRAGSLCSDAAIAAGRREDGTAAKNGERALWD